MAISRADLLKELLPGLNELFGVEYKKHNDRYERYERNRQLHGLEEPNQSIIELSHKIAPEGYSKRGAL